MRSDLPYRAELHGTGGIIAILEHTSLDYIKAVVAREWLPTMQHGDTLKIIETAHEV